MPINLDQTGPAHLLSTDEDGLILNGSPVISKSIHVSDDQPYTYDGEIAKKLLWLDTSVPGITAFPEGGAPNYILRTDGMGNVSWIPPSSLDVTKFRYLASDSRFNADPGTGYVRFRRVNDPYDLKTMAEAAELLISASDKFSNDISGFINALTLYGNSNRRGFIKIEKEDDPNFFQVWDFNTVEDNTTWFRITATCVRGIGVAGNFDPDDPILLTFSSAGPEALTQDLTPYVLITGTQTLTNKTLTSPTISGLYLSDSSIVFEGAFPGNDYETTLTVVNPTADRTVTIPDATTTLVGTDVTQTLTNKTLTAPNISDPNINLTYTNGTASKNITLSSALTTAFNTRIGTTSNNQYSWTTNISYNGTQWVKDDNNRGAWRINKVAALDDATSQIALTYAAIGTNNIADMLLVSGEGIITLPVNVSSTDSSTGTLVVAGGVGIGENLNVENDLTVVGILEAGSIQSTPIGTLTRSTGAFTTLAANQAVTFTNAADSTDPTSGALVVTGGVGIGGKLNAEGPVFINELDLSETKLGGYSLVLQGNQAKFRVGPNYTAGAIDYIDIKTQEDNPIITTVSDNLTIENAQAGGNITLFADSAAVIVSETTAAISTTSGALQVLGGVGVSLDVHANDMYSGGSQVVTLAAIQTISNKTLLAPILDDTELTGTLTANNSTGISGQLLESTGTGVRWVNPVNLSGMFFTKPIDQSFFSPAIVHFIETPTSSIGTFFGSMDSGTFTFTTAGTYQITINYNVSVIGGGGGYPQLDCWVRKNGNDTTKYLNVLTDSSRRGSVTEVISFAVNDTMTWYMNSSLVVSGTGSTATRLSILRLS